MGVFSTSAKDRGTYRIEIKYSLLWEAALGIAAVTNKPLHDSLEKPKTYWGGIKETVSAELNSHLEYVEQNNTWKALLQLLHNKDFATLDQFTSYIEHLPANELKFSCLPFVDKHTKR